MNGERLEEPEHEGEHYLRLLDMGHLAGHQITAAGRTIEVRDFLEICGDHARPVLMGLEMMRNKVIASTGSDDDPEYLAFKEAARKAISGFLEGDKPAV